MDDEIRSDIDKILYWMRGNGEKGVFARLSDAEKNLETVTDSVDQADKKLRYLVQERQNELAEWRGIKKAIYIIAVVLGLAGAGGYASIVSLLRSIAQSAP